MLGLLSRRDYEVPVNPPLEKDGIARGALNGKVVKGELDRMLLE